MLMEGLFLGSLISAGSSWWGKRTRKKRNLLLCRTQEAQSIPLVSRISSRLVGRPGSRREEKQASLMIGAARRFVNTDVFEHVIRGLVRENSPLHRMVRS